MRNGGSGAQCARGVARASVALVVLLASTAGRGESAANEAIAQGKVELSTGLSLSRQSSQGNSFTRADVPLRVGVMLDGRFEVEGELLLEYAKRGVGSFASSETGLTAAGHVLYHFAPGSRTVPFLLAGAGYGNPTSVENAAWTGGLWLVRGGAGVKCFVGRHGALRSEYRFTHESGSWKGECNLPEGCGSVPSRAAVNEHAVIVGISLWF